MKNELSTLKYSILDVKQLYDKYILSISSEEITLQVLKQNLVIISEFLGLKYETTMGEELFFSKELYGTLEKYYIEQNKFLKGSNDLVDQSEICVALNLDQDKVTKEHFKKITSLITPKSFFNNSFKYSRLEVEKLREKLFTTEEVKKIIEDRYPNVNISMKEFHRIMLRHYPETEISFYKKKKFYYKDIIESIDFNLINDMKAVSNSRTFKLAIDASLKNGYLLTVAANILGIHGSIVSRIANEGKVLRFADDSRKYINKQDVEKWRKFKECHISIGNIYNKIEKNIIGKYQVNKHFMYETFYKFRTSEILNEFNPIDDNDTCFLSGFLFVRNENEDAVAKLIEHHMKKAVINVYGSKIDMFEYSISCNQNKCINQTLIYLSAYANDRFSRFKSISVITFESILNEIMNLNKELMACDDEEIAKILNKLNTNRVKDEFCKFIMYLKKVSKTTFVKRYSFNRRINIKNNKSNNLPYTIEQYLRFGFLVLSDTHIWYESYREKAIAYRKYASIWLYAVLHYTCAWRGVDMRENLPRPTLNMPPRDFINLVKNRQLTDKQACEITDEVSFKIKMLTINPKKTDSYTTPKLVLEIPESIKAHLGMLLGLAEAHCQLSKSNKLKGIISSDCTNVNKQKEFFEKEFINIFKGEAFSNLRANKSYELLTAKNGDQYKLGTGYVLASVARSHKFLDKKAESTSVYLKYFYKMDDSEALISELFERGVCSFLPYLLAKAINGPENVMNLGLLEQRKLIKDTIPTDNYDTELTLQLFDRVVENSKEKVISIIKEYQYEGKNPKEEIKKLVEKLAHNIAPSKNENMGCISVAQGKGCIYPKREDCIGCGQEIYLKSFMNELGKYFNRVKTAAYGSKTKGSKMKNILIMKNVLIPIGEEIFVTLRQIYKVEDLSIYKELLGRQ